MLNVAKFHKFAAQLLPRTSRGRFSGKHRLAVDNYGNSPVIATFRAEDAENSLDVPFSPKTLLVEPGTAAFTKIKVKPRRKFLLGPPRAAPFKIWVAYSDKTDDGKTVPLASGEPVPPVDGLHMQRSVLPALLLPIAALVIAGVILWAIFRPQPEVTAADLAPAQQAAEANELTARSINVAHQDAVAARTQSAKQAALARKDAEETQKQVAQAASAARKDAEKTQQQAAKATAAAGAAGATANNAVRTAGKALQAATPPFAGTPFGQRLALPADCTPSCTSPQPFTAQAFPAQTFYVTDIRVGNPGNGKGTLTLALGGKPVLVEPLASVTGADVKPSTPLLVQGGEALAARVSCTEGSVHTVGLPLRLFPGEAARPDRAERDTELEAAFAVVSAGVDVRGHDGAGERNVVRADGRDLPEPRGRHGHDHALAGRAAVARRGARRLERRRPADHARGADPAQGTREADAHRQLPELGRTEMYARRATDRRAEAPIDRTCPIGQISARSGERGDHALRGASAAGISSSMTSVAETEPAV